MLENGRIGNHPVTGVAKVKPPMSRANSVSAVASHVGFGLSSTTPQHPVPKKIIRRKRAASYERRFLSEKCPAGKGILEVAMMWSKDDVVRLTQFSRPESVTAGSVVKKNSFAIIDIRLGETKELLFCREGRWMLRVDSDFDGFVVGDAEHLGAAKVAFKDLKPSAENGILNDSGHFLIPMDGTYRAKIVFGDVSLLIHLGQPAATKVPKFAPPAKSNVASLAMSTMMHLAFFSVILFATTRVEALMVDHVMTTARFADELMQPADIVEEEDIAIDEVEVPDVEPDEVVADSGYAVPTRETSAGSGVSNGPMSKEAARAAANNIGILAQANVMNSMLNVFALDSINESAKAWDTFDPNVANAVNMAPLVMTNAGAPLGPRDGFRANFNPKPLPKPVPGTITLGPKNPRIPCVGCGCGGVGCHVDVSGSIDKRIIQKVVRQHTGELRNCYDKGLIKNKELAGRVEMVWFVSTEGIVTNAKVLKTTLNEKSVEDCIVMNIKRWRFPAAHNTSPARVIYPFSFTPGTK